MWRDAFLFLILFISSVTSGQSASWSSDDAPYKNSDTFDQILRIGQGINDQMNNLKIRAQSLDGEMKQIKSQMSSTEIIKDQLKVAKKEVFMAETDVDNLSDQENITEFSQITTCDLMIDISMMPETADDVDCPVGKSNEGYCVYSLEREPRLKKVSKRLYNPQPVATNCEYPGVIGVFDANDLSAQCTLVLLDEQTVLMDTFCMGTVSSGHYQVLAKSYNKSDISNNEIDPSTLQLLDATSPQKTELYTAKLRTPLELDSKCIQPACIPNKDIQATDINFEDCRFVGYGNTEDMNLAHNYLPDPVEQLMEVEVTVDESSITDNVLKTTRKSGSAAANTGPCFYDNSSPLICSHKTSLEWIVVGVTSLIGYPCSNPAVTDITVQNLLSEAESPDYYNNLQTFKYSHRAKII